MNDDISKEYLKEHIKACWINGRPKYSPELHEVLSWIDDVPSAEPEIKERMEKSAQNVPNNDLISRKAAIDKLNREIIKRRLLDELYDGALDEFQTEEILRKLPSAQPEPQWIPCSERLPEDSQFVLMTIRRMDEHYNHEPFISVGYITWNQSLWWCAHDGDCEPNNVRVDAWMPLPEPWKGEQP